MLSLKEIEAYRDYLSRHIETHVDATMLDNLEQCLLVSDTPEEVQEGLRNKHAFWLATQPNEPLCKGVERLLRILEGRGEYASLAEIRVAHQGPFFENCRKAGTHLYPSVYGGRYFISREPKNEGIGVSYTIWNARGGRINPVAVEYTRMPSLEKARQVARDLANDLRWDKEA